MEYTVIQLAKISGVSARTLRYYDQIGLLKPERIELNGYRIYGKCQVELLQQILFYRELGIGLKEISKILNSPNFNCEEALQRHLIALKQKKLQIEQLIQTVLNTMNDIKGEYIMNDAEKFEGFKKEIIEQNEIVYGDEIRRKYGNEMIDASKAVVQGMTEEQWSYQKELENRIKNVLREAMDAGGPDTALAQTACDLHRQWICMLWKPGTYSKQAHKGLGQLYVSDERFCKYYDEVGEGAAAFLNEALKIYCEQ